MDFADLMKQALALSREDRMRLIEAIDASFSVNDPTLSPTKRAELARRLAAFEADPEGTTLDGETAMQQLQDELQRKRAAQTADVR